MTSYAELSHHGRKACPLYLELRALGLDLRAEEDVEDPSGYRMSLVGTRSLSPDHASRLHQRIAEHRLGLARILSHGTWGGDLAAIRREGEAG